MKYVELQSTINITVTKGLDGIDHSPTKPTPGIDNQLRVQPLWAETAVQIKVGKHIYPAEIKEWPTVKVLVEKGIFTIGQETDGEGKPADEIKKADEKQKEIDAVAAALKKKSALETAAGE